MSTSTESTRPTSTIVGVELEFLKTFPDDRGFFREVLRRDDAIFQNSFGQWSHSKMGRNTVKAWHFHHRQTDWWYCGVGVIHTVLYDAREESPTYRTKFEIRMGDTDLDPSAYAVVVKIPPGVLHGMKVVSEPAHLFYITDHTYNPQDEGRLPFNTADVPHNWGPEEELITSEKDRKLFIPPYDREKRVK